MSYININHIDKDMNLWDKGLDFYKDELRIMEKRLAEVSAKNNGHESEAGVEHFQNQFLIQRKNIQDIKHEINRYNHNIATDVKEHAGHVDTALQANGMAIKDQYEGFERVMNGLRKEFNEFLSKWM